MYARYELISNGKWLIQVIGNGAVVMSTQISGPADLGGHGLDHARDAAQDLLAAAVEQVRAIRRETAPFIVLPEPRHRVEPVYDAADEITAYKCQECDHVTSPDKLEGKPWSRDVTVAWFADHRIARWLDGSDE